MVDKGNDYIISRLKEKYGDKYDYSLVKYKGWRQPITLVCNRCGSKRVVPTVSNALSQNIQCTESKCKKEDSRKAFEERGKELYGDHLDVLKTYLSTNYKYLVDDSYFKSPVEVIKYLNLDRDADTKIISAYKVRYY